MLVTPVSVYKVLCTPERRFRGNVCGLPPSQQTGVLLRCRVLARIGDLRRQALGDVHSGRGPPGRPGAWERLGRALGRAVGVWPGAAPAAWLAGTGAPRGARRTSVRFQEPSASDGVGSALAVSPGPGASRLPPEVPAPCRRDCRLRHRCLGTRTVVRWLRDGADLIRERSTSGPVGARSPEPRRAWLAPGVRSQRGFGEVLAGSPETHAC